MLRGKEKQIKQNELDGWTAIFLTPSVTPSLFLSIRFSRKSLTLNLKTTMSVKSISVHIFWNFYGNHGRTYNSIFY